MTARPDASIATLQLRDDIVALYAPIETLSANSEYETECAAVAAAVPARQAEFLAGRALAREGLGRLGIAPVPIEQNPDRTPGWPDGVIGSISHTRSHALVAVSVSPKLAGIGVDLEFDGSVDADLRSIVRHDDDDSRCCDTCLFSAKEAAFKAVYPICGEFLDFGDLAIHCTDTPNAFEALCRPGLDSGAWLRRGHGEWRLQEGMIFSIYFIPA